MSWTLWSRLLSAFRQRRGSVAAKPLRAQPHPATSRRIHLGVDYGTAWSKLVFRDYEAKGGDRSFVVRSGDTADYRIPSLIVLHDGRLWFGAEALTHQRGAGATSFHSMKIRMALPGAFYGNATPLPDGVTEVDLATLMVLYLLQVGHLATLRYTEKLKATPKLSMTLGVPMSQLDQPELRERFAQLAQTAVHLLQGGSHPLDQGISLAEARELLQAAREELADKPAANPEAWVRSEVASALLWAFHSPKTASGLYAAVDVGAGTTSASWFCITEWSRDGARGKEGLIFYGASCRPPGADALDRHIAERISLPDPAQARLGENEYLRQLSQDDPELVGIMSGIFDTYREAFSRAYPKHAKQSAWFGARLFLLGGGTRIGAVRRRLRERAWGNLEADPPLVDPGVPEDLLELDGGPLRAEADFLLVAYGLSHYAADVPEVTGPSDVEPVKFPPPTFGYDVDDMYCW